MKEFIRYGTAGFRDRADMLDAVLYRIGQLAVLRSKKKTGQAIGLMITASHNPECDNGVKLIDPFGEMLEESWEEVATSLANSENESLNEVISKVVQEQEINLNSPSLIYIGRDTRSSGLQLSQSAIAGIQSMNGEYRNFGIVTTPFLHYMVYCRNAFQKEPKEEDYNSKMINSFEKLNLYKKEGNGNYKPHLYIDGANGVGALKMKEIKDGLENLFQINIYNSGEGILNYKCGADFVKVQKKPPEGVPKRANVRCLSFDGDADRLIYYYIDESNRFRMLDGDRIAILIAGYLTDLIRKSNLDINLGIVQTAYANGSSTNYIKNVLKIPVTCSPTGVKHLHHRALSYEIGVYFEANGHGSVLYSRTAEEKIKNKSVETASTTNDERDAARRLSALIELTNQTVGDALSDALIVETILKARGWNLADWENMYTDLPNRLLKVSVKDNATVKTDSTEQICLNPEGLQDRINALMAAVKCGRSFIRPSGTEKVVRVYSEASTQEDADNLALSVALAVYELAGGVGDVPSIAE